MDAPNATAIIQCLNEAVNRHWGTHGEPPRCLAITVSAVKAILPSFSFPGPYGEPMPYPAAYGCPLAGTLLFFTLEPNGKKLEWKIDFKTIPDGPVEGTLLIGTKHNETSSQ